MELEWEKENGWQTEGAASAEQMAVNSSITFAKPIQREKV
jgi:hypothetical protein